MKPFLLLPLAGTLALLCRLPARAQPVEARESLHREFTLAAEASRSTLALYNFSGSVTIQGHAGNQVVVDVTKTIRAPDAPTLQQGQRQAQLQYRQRGDSVMVYMQGPVDSRPQRPVATQARIRYIYTFDYVVRVPFGMNLDVYTVNNGALRVQDVTGTLNVANTNGPLTLHNVRGSTRASTVTGDLEATYAGTPPGPSSYKTNSGQIRVAYPAGVAADVYFQSRGGQFFSRIPSVPLPPPAAETRAADAAATPPTAVRLGKGGPVFRFETYGGNVVLSPTP